MRLQVLDLFDKLPDFGAVRQIRRAKRRSILQGEHHPNPFGDLTLLDREAPAPARDQDRVLDLEVIDQIIKAPFLDTVVEILPIFVERDEMITTHLSAGHRTGQTRAPDLVREDDDILDPGDVPREDLRETYLDHGTPRTC